MVKIRTLYNPRKHNNHFFLASHKSHPNIHNVILRHTKTSHIPPMILPKAFLPMKLCKNIA